MLDPVDWERFRAAAHEALDDAIDFLRDVRDRRVWTPVPDRVKLQLSAPMPQEGTPFDAVYREFAEAILPYVTGNIHPRFWGWVHGTGTPGGAVAELLAAVMNSNTGGRDHGAVYVERQVIRWFLQLFEFPDAASGLIVTGTSAANFIAVLVARTAALGSEVRETGLDRLKSGKLRAYASTATHACVRKAFEAAGLGSGALRVLPVDSDHRIDTHALRKAVADDRAEGLHPFLIVGNAGTVDTGTIDPLEDLASIASSENLWFHVDGAFGAAAYLSPHLRPKLEGIERADSLAFDFHKWLHVPYDAGCVLLRDGALHRATFASEGPYITRTDRGLAAGEPWFADYGIELSRGFRALKVWFTIKEHGARGLAHAIETNCNQAAGLQRLLEDTGRFEILAPAELQIVCFRPLVPELTQAQIDRLVVQTAIELQESGIAVISTTTLAGRRALRACITNHRTAAEDLPIFMNALARTVDGLRETIA